MLPKPLSHTGATLDLFFVGAPRSAVAKLETFAVQREYEPRQIIYFPGDACNHLYCIHSGRVKITRAFSAGRQHTFRHLVSGDLFGQELLTGRKTRLDYAEAMTPTLLALVPGEDFLRIIRTEPGIGAALARYLAGSLFHIEETMCDMARLDAPRRVACCLWRLCRQENRESPAPLPVTHQDISSLTGITRETVTAILHRLRDAGMVSLANRRIVVLQLARLRKFAEDQRPGNDQPEKP